MGYARVIEKDRGWNRIMEDIKKLSGSSTQAGLFGSGGDEESDVAARGAVHEFGDRKGRIPQRPFTRNAFDANENKIKKRVFDDFGNMIEGKLPPKMVLAKAGELLAELIQRSIRQGTFTPLKIDTILKKGSSRPLIDTAVMANSVTHKEFMK